MYNNALFLAKNNSATSREVQVSFPEQRGIIGLIHESWARLFSFSNYSLTSSFDA